MIGGPGWARRAVRARDVDQGSLACDTTMAVNLGEPKVMGTRCCAHSAPACAVAWAKRLAGAEEVAAWTSRGVLAGVDDWRAVDQDVLDAARVGQRLVDRRGTIERLVVEYHHIRETASMHEAAIAQTEVRCRHTRHFANGVLQSQQAQLCRFRRRPSRHGSERPA